MKISKESVSKAVKNPYTITGTAAVIVVAIAAGFGYYRQVSKSTPTPTPTVTPLPTESASPSPSASPQISPSASPSATPTKSDSVQTLPDSAKKVTDSFYTAYKAKNITEIGSFFTDDTTDELKSLHSRLFTGLDTDGVPGGPTLFSSNSASQSVSSYAIVSATEDGSSWEVTVSEQRLSGAGEQAGTVSTVLKLVPSGDSWQIDGYYHAGLSGKYDGFLIQ